MSAPQSMTVFVPLTLRKRNGRPKIMPPTERLPTSNASADPHVICAIARAWSWRRKLESGKASTLLDNAVAENVTDWFVSRMVRLAYLSPGVLQSCWSTGRSRCR